MQETMIAEAVTSGEYTELLTRVVELLENIDTSLLGIYAVGWILVGSIIALGLVFSLLHLFKT